MKDKGRWITIAGQHIYIEEGETPMSAYVRHMAGKGKYKKMQKEAEKRNEEQAKETKFKENEKLLREGKENKFRMIGSFLEKNEEFTDNWKGLDSKDKERIKQKAIDHLNQRIRALGGDEDLEKNKEKYADAYVQYRVDRITDMKKKRRLGEESNNKIEANEVKVGNSSDKKDDFKKFGDRIDEEIKAIGSIDKYREQVEKNTQETNKRRERIKENRKVLTEKFQSNKYDDVSENKETTQSLTKKLSSDDSEGMNSGTRYQENKFGVKDQALLYDENKRPSNSWIPTKQAMITYYKKRAKEENNQYYSDNAERLAEEYIKYREELKKKGRN